MIGARKVKPWLLESFGLNFLRGLFVTSVSSTLVLLGFLYIRITSANDRTPVKVTKKAAANGPAQEETVTTRDYDIGELNKLFSRTAMGLGICLFLHLKWGYDDPLLMQAILIPVQTFTSQLVKIHLLATAPVGDLQRPFKEHNPLQALLEGQQGAATPGSRAANQPRPAIAPAPRRPAAPAGSTLKQRQPQAAEN